MFELHNSQLVMYLGDKQGAGQACILCGRILIKGTPDTGKLQSAINEVFRINNGLRTYFIEKDGKVFQDYRPFSEKHFEELHFKNEEELDRWGEKYATIPLKLDKEVIGAPLDLKATAAYKKPALRLVLNVIRHGIAISFVDRSLHRPKSSPSCCDVIPVILPDSYGVILKLHHATADAWTVMLLANQFIRILNGETVKAYDYPEFLENEKEYKESKRYLKDKAYALSVYEKCSEPTWMWPVQYTSLNAERLSVRVGDELRKKIFAYAAAHEVTPYALFLSALSVYMRKCLERDSFYLGSVVINREGVRERNMVGMFVRGLPLLMEVSAGEIFADVVSKTMDNSMTGFRHQKGFQDNQFTTSYLYDVWASYLEADLEADADVECRQFYCKSAVDITIMTIENHERTGETVIHFDYNTSKVPRSDGKALLDGVVKILEAGLSDDRRTVGDITKDL